MLHGYYVRLKTIEWKDKRAKKEKKIIRNGRREREREGEGEKCKMLSEMKNENSGEEISSFFAESVRKISQN
jgi:hypothetical protein